MTKLFKFLVTGALFVTVLSCVSDEGIPLTLIEASQEAGLTTFASAAQSQFGFLGILVRGMSLALLYLLLPMKLLQMHWFSSRLPI